MTAGESGQRESLQPTDLDGRGEEKLGVDEIRGRGLDRRWEQREGTAT